jgi:hypothetical protein
MGFSIVTSGLQMIPAPSGGGFAPPTLFTLVQQGGSSNSTAPVGNSNAFAIGGAAPFYKLYRRLRTSSFVDQPWGNAIATISAGSAATALAALASQSQPNSSTVLLPAAANGAYTDSTATNNNIITLASAPTVYQYALTATDGGSNESVMVYPNCVIFAGNTNTASINNGYGNTTTNAQDTSGAPVPGPFDVRVDWANGGGWLPYLTPAICQGANNFPNDLEIGGFNWWQIDVMVSDTQYLTNPLNFGITTRIPPGDAFSWTTHNLWNYGSPAVGQWRTFRIPITALTKGITTFSGRIIGTGPGTGTLTATVTAPNFVDNSSYITGPNVPAGTYCVAFGTITDANGSGTYTVNGPGLTAGLDTGVQLMTYQCTGFYKSGFQWQNDTTTTLRFNNFMLTTI